MSTQRTTGNRSLKSQNAVPISLASNVDDGLVYGSPQVLCLLTNGGVELREERY